MSKPVLVVKGDTITRKISTAGWKPGIHEIQIKVTNPDGVAFIHHGVVRLVDEL